MKKINIIGGGLAGCEAAFFLANKGIKVNLYEMRPKTTSPAHHSDKLGELVCSNSLKSKKLDNACGLLKKELEVLDSLIMLAALNNEVPGGHALCVDREGFSFYIDQKIKNHPNITLIEEEVTSLKDGINLIASGPLTSKKLLQYLEDKFGTHTLSFFDASSPIVTKDSLDLNKLYFKARYDKGDGNYLNAPLTKEEYFCFYNELINAKVVTLHDFEKGQLFAGCQPLEILAKQGVDTLRFGPLKPQGLEHENLKPYAVVQLRQDDFSESLYSLVGFQTNLTYPEQKRVFSLIPGLENAQFVRYGLMHQNAYFSSPSLLSDELNLKLDNDVYLCGQISGVEGYVESAMSGLIVAMVLYQRLQSKKIIIPPKNTMSGALIRYTLYANPQYFQPMNAMYNLLPNYDKNRKEALALDALKEIKLWRDYVNE